MLASDTVELELRSRLVDLEHRVEDVSTAVNGLAALTLLLSLMVAAAVGVKLWKETPWKPA